MTRKQPLTITVFGLGFVGLTTALGFAQQGCRVYGFENNRDRKAMLEAGMIPFHEPGMAEAMRQHQNRRFFVGEKLEKALQESRFIFYCVGTPAGENGEADLTQLMNALDQTLEGIQDEQFRVLIVKSTVPPGTVTERVVPYLQQQGIQPGTHLGIANNPEFLREGCSWEDFMHPDRIVLGTSDAMSRRMLEELYQPFQAPIRFVGHTTAEFSKYLSNALLATMISYANEMAVMADHLGGIETREAFRILHDDKRWKNGEMKGYVLPGTGFGGACLPKDTEALAAAARHKGMDPRMLHRVMAVNREMPAFTADRVGRAAAPGDRIGILGLAFKPGSDDVRNTTAVPVIQELLHRGYTRLTAYDPLALANFQAAYPELPLAYSSDLKQLMENCDALLILTAWPEFAGLQSRTEKPVIDGRYMLGGDGDET